MLVSCKVKCNNSTPLPPQILANTPLEARSQTQVGSQRFLRRSNPDMKYFKEYFKIFFSRECQSIFRSSDPDPYTYMSQLFLFQWRHIFPTSPSLPFSPSLSSSLSIIELARALPNLPETPTALSPNLAAPSQALQLIRTFRGNW